MAPATIKTCAKKRLRVVFCGIIIRIPSLGVNFITYSVSRSNVLIIIENIKEGDDCQEKSAQDTRVSSKTSSGSPTKTFDPRPQDGVFRCELSIMVLE
jgi:hypothetical protein